MEMRQLVRVDDVAYRSDEITLHRQGEDTHDFALDPYQQRRCLLPCFALRAQAQEVPDADYAGNQPDPHWKGWQRGGLVDHLGSGDCIADPTYLQRAAASCPDVATPIGLSAKEQRDHEVIASRGRPHRGRIGSTRPAPDMPHDGVRSDAPGDGPDDERIDEKLAGLPPGAHEPARPDACPGRLR
jgi:hypothetical protein